jgi:hypothetical protein
MDIDTINRSRDRKLRRAMLRLLRIARGQSPTGELSGRTLVDLVNRDLVQSDQFEDEQHALTLMSDMEGRGYVVRRDVRTRKLERFTVSAVALAITPKGMDLLDENIAADPAVEDERVGQ